MNKLGSIRVGKGARTVIMGIINVSPESFYSKSVYTSASSISAAARRMQSDGADIIDIGGMSTAPYLKTYVKSEIEMRRVLEGVKAVRAASSLPISVDTNRADVAEAALNAGASIINDITGLNDSHMVEIIGRYRPSLILCAYGGLMHKGNGLIKDTVTLLKSSIKMALKAGAYKNQIAIDPAIGFFRHSSKSPFFTRASSDQTKRDLLMISKLDQLGNMPVLVSVSRKSFLGNILLESDPEKRLSGSLACEMAAIQCGADIIRTHNVCESRRVADIADMNR